MKRLFIIPIPQRTAICAHCNSLILMVVLLFVVLSSHAQYTQIPDDNFEAALEAIITDDISGDGQVPTQEIAALVTLDISDSTIADLSGIEDFSNLTELNASDNLLTTVDLSNNTTIQTLTLSSNPLTTLDLSTLTNLEELTLSDTDVTELDLSKNTALTYLISTGNDIERYDFRNNSALSTLVTIGNYLKYINLKNGNNNNIVNHAIYGDPSLCVSVDNLSYAQSNLNNVQSTAIYTDDYCRYTQIPDSNFENALSVYDDIANDGQVPTINIEDLTSLDVKNQGITDLTGLEDFTNLTLLVASQNNITSLDVSNNKLLEHLTVQECASLTGIQFEGNSALTNMSAWGNALESIDLSELTNLKSLVISDNNISAIDFSNNLLIEEVFINNNPIEEVDLSKNSNLILFGAQECNLSVLNLKNGANDNIYYFNTLNNPNLVCIQVDDSVDSRANWTNIDDTSNFSTTCGSFTLSPKVLLEGAFDFDGADTDYLMHNNLSTVLPTTSPYEDALTCESSLFSLTDEYAVVDWVEIQIRNPDDISEILYRRSALLLRNGDVVDTDGEENPRCYIWQSNYYVSIAHRNHLTIATNIPQRLRSTPVGFAIDFMDQNNVLGGNAALSDMGDDYFAMPMGDIDANGQVQNSDVNTTITQIGISGYNVYDADMNGQVQNSDVNIILQNIGKGKQF